MENYKYIRQQLLHLGINQFKIIESNEKSFIYKDVFENVSYDNIHLSNIFVLLKIKDKISAFTVSSNLSKQLINKIIKESINNAFQSNFIYDNINEVKQPDLSTNKFAHIFKKFNPEHHRQQIFNEVLKIKKSTSLSLNIIINICSSQHKLLTANKEFIQYSYKSECICIENKYFKKSALLHQFTSLQNLSNEVIDKLNEQIDFSPQKINCSEILIKNTAVSQIVNSLIAQFYADSVYLNNSIIKVQNIGKQICHNNINLSSIPYDKIIFDGEGYLTKEKILVKNGYLIDLLSNQGFSKYLKLKNCGNASLKNNKQITHQVLKFCINNTLKQYNSKQIITMTKIKNLAIDPNKGSINMVANFHDGICSYCSLIELNIINFLNNIYSTSINENLNLINNVYCHDIIYKTNLQKHLKGGDI